MGKNNIIFLILFFILNIFQVSPLKSSAQPFPENQPHKIDGVVEWRGESVSNNTVAVQLLAINETGRAFPPPLAQAYDTGKPILAGYLKKVESKMPGATFFLHAGDQNLIELPENQHGTSQETSLFTMLGNSHCHPTGGYDRECNFIGIPSNHEFTQGVDEMLRLLYGSSEEKSEYHQNSFPSICANLVETESGYPVFQPYVVRLVDGVPIGFIGALLKTQRNAALIKDNRHLTVNSEAKSINKYVQVLQGLGVHTIVVMIHQGNEQQPRPTTRSTSELNENIQAVLSQLDKEVDVVLSSQSHSYHNTLFRGPSGQNMLVVQAWPLENGVAQIQLEISRASAEVVAMRSTVHSTEFEVLNGQKKAKMAILNTQGQTNEHQPVQTSEPQLPFPEGQEAM